MFRTLLLEVTKNRRTERILSWAHARFIVLKAEFARVLADDGDILPSQSVKSLSSDFAQGGRKVDKVDTGEEVGNIDKAAHGLNVPPGAATNLCKFSSLVSLNGEGCFFFSGKHSGTYVNPNPFVLILACSGSLFRL